MERDPSDCGNNPPEHAPSSCAAHLAAAGATVDAFRQSLPDGHVIATMVDEHTHILGKLDELEAAVQAGGAAPSKEVLSTIHGLGTFLLGVEPHHQREEQVLFPLLRQRGMDGPPNVMEFEHQELRALKKTITDTSGTLRDAGEGSWDGLVHACKILLATLRAHIDKENHMLYPMAMQVIREEEVWVEAKRRCDEIGYCCGGG